MSFVISKTAGVVAVLPNLLAVIGLVGLLLLWTRCSALGRRLIIGSFIALTLCGFTPLGSLLLEPLENRFPAWVPTADPPTGIVILGGTTKPEVSAFRGLAVSDIGIDRLIAGAMLARRYPHARIIYSGGSPELRPNDLREADFALQLLNDLGVPKARVEVEDKSRNTAENATFSSALASPAPADRWLLVTSAYHMPRAVGLFRKAGFPVEPVPTGWLTASRGSWLDFGNFGPSMLLVHIASREWIGLAAYRALGNTDTLLPKPNTP
ncbi:YdcF family protein [Bradyrhizobium yuanmingense]|uniref:YdcF family protein n=1 Tax=Bradyrhizobium yuanmingense TaxID=108015 RepID=UPI0023B92A2B|nr:YdcF family protein [Bradyrhizobium yuanmingense]MDF0581266.1 YdcF family protein [Bradyrhizobium yuanmingense]